MPLRIPPPVLLRDPWLGVIVQFLRALSQALVHGQVITSWYRTPQFNRSIGGDADSQHLFGLAMDIAGPQLVFSLGLARRNGLVAVMERDHLHVQAFPKGALKRAGVRFPIVPPVAVAEGPEVTSI